MWFLKFWIITSVLTLVIVIVGSIGSSNRLKRAGYRFRKEEKSVVERLEIFLPCFIPLFNIVLILYMILTPVDKLDALVLKDLEKKNLLKEPEEW